MADCSFFDLENWYICIVLITRAFPASEPAGSLNCGSAPACPSAEFRAKAVKIHETRVELTFFFPRGLIQGFLEHRIPLYRIPLSLRPLRSL